MEQEQQQQPNDDEEWKKIREKHLKKLKKLCYRRFVYLGIPIPLGIMVPSESADRGWANPLLRNLLQQQQHQDYINKESSIALFMIPGIVIMAVTVMVSICNPSYASLGVLFWCYCICILCTLTYLFWLRYKNKLGEKYRVSIAKWALELRKELPDQCDEYLINRMSNKATESLRGFNDFLNDFWMWYAVSNGMFGMLLCGKNYSGFRDSWMASGCILGLYLCVIYFHKRLLVTSDDDKLKVSMEQPPDDDIVSSDDDDELKVSMDYGKQRHRLADLGVPMPPGMVLKKSTRFMIPILENLVVDERKIIVIRQEYLNRNAFIAFVMMPVIFVVIVVVSIYNPSYASLGFGLWFCCIYVLCTLSYLVWLTYKERLLEMYRLRIAEGVLQERKKLPTVEVDNVEADQCADDLINELCYRATIPLNISYCWIYSAVLVGILGIVFCGEYYWNAY